MHSCFPWFHKVLENISDGKNAKRDLLDTPLIIRSFCCESFIPVLPIEYRKAGGRAVFVIFLLTRYNKQKIRKTISTAVHIRWHGETIVG